MSRRANQIVFWIVLLTLALSGCGGGETDAPPTRRPTDIPPTPTPRSTPLPGVESAPMLGSDERPITIHFTAAGTGAPQAAQELREELASRTGLTFETALDNENEALSALCSGAPAAAWVSAYSYVVALRTCDVVPVLAVKQGTGRDVTIGTTSEIIARINFTSLSQLGSQVFCRSAEHDLDVTWIFPGLLLTNAGIDPLTELAAVVDYPDDVSVGRAIYQGECAAAAFPADTWDDLSEDVALALSTEENPISVAAVDSVIQIVTRAGGNGLPANESTWAGYPANVAPYDVLVFAPESAIPAQLRNDLATMIADFFDDRADGPDRAQDLLDASGVVAVQPRFFTNFQSLVDRAGWNMALEN